MAAALPLPEVVSMSGHDLTPGDGQGALFVLPVVCDADSPRAREIAEAMPPLTELSAR